MKGGLSIKCRVQLQVDLKSIHRIGTIVNPHLNRLDGESVLANMTNLRKHIEMHTNGNLGVCHYYFTLEEE